MKNILVLTSSFHRCNENPLGSVHSLVTALSSNGINVYLTGKCECAYRKVRKREIRDIGRVVDFIIIMYCNIPASISCENLDGEHYFKELPNINRWDKTAYIDYFEYSWRNQYSPVEPFYHKYFYRHCKHYFKRECYPEHLQMNMIPFPLSYVPYKHIDYFHTDKLYDIFCCFGQQSTGMRASVLDLCKRLQIETNLNILIATNIPRSEYLENIRRSWITIDAKGAGYVNHRFLEIIGNRGLCFREKYPIVFHNDYIDKRLVIEYETIEMLEKTLKEMLIFTEGIETTERLAYNHYVNNHTAEAVGKFLINKLI